MAMGFGIVISYQIKIVICNYNGDHGILVLDFNFKF